MAGGFYPVASLFLLSAVETGVTSGESILIGHGGYEGAGADGDERIVKMVKVGGNT